MLIWRESSKDLWCPQYCCKMYDVDDLWGNAILLNSTINIMWARNIYWTQTLKSGYKSLKFVIVATVTYADKYSNLKE